MQRGRLITIEGIDGAGKTTLAAELKDALSTPSRRVVLLREPGGVAASERIRGVVKDPELTVGPRAEALLYAAARAQLVDEALTPQLQDGTWILLDRFVDSSLAYQGAGRGLGMADVAAINEFATRGLTPDRTLLLSIDPATGRARSQHRGEPVDRLEREDQSFYARIQAAYQELAAAAPDRIRTIDAAQEPAKVLADALAALSDLS